MYREKTKEGEIFGGPMYVIKNGLPKRMLPLAYFFALAGMIGCLPAFQSNQLIQITGDLAFSGIENFNIFGGLALACITGIVVIGGLKRIAEVATFLVPLMGSIYFGAMLIALTLNLDLISALQSLLQNKLNPLEAQEMLQLQLFFLSRQLQLFL